MSLAVNHLIGFGARRATATGADASISYVSANSSATGATSHTFTAQSIGAGSYVLVGIVGAAAAAVTISSITVGGNACTLTTIGSNTFVAGFGMIAHPGGSTADIVVSYSGTVARAGIVVWAVSSIGVLTAYASANDTSATGQVYSASLDVPAGGICAAVALNNSTSSATTTWSGVTERVDSTFASGRTYTGGSDAFATLQTGLSVSVTFSAGASSSREGLYVASWAKA